MRTTIIILSVFAVLLMGLCFKLWNAGYQRGHADATAAVSAEARLSQAEILYFTHSGSMRPSSVFTKSYQVQNDRQQLVRYYEDVKTAAADPDLPEDSHDKMLIEHIDQSHVENLAYLDDLLLKLQTSEQQAVSSDTKN